MGFEWDNFDILMSFDKLPATPNQQNERLLKDETLKQACPELDSGFRVIEKSKTK